MFKSSFTFTSAKLNIHEVNYNKQLPLCVINYDAVGQHNGRVVPLPSVALDNSSRIGRVCEKIKIKKIKNKFKKGEKS